MGAHKVCASTALARAHVRIYIIGIKLTEMLIGLAWILIFLIKLYHCTGKYQVAMYDDFRFSFVLMVCDFNSDRWRKEYFIGRAMRAYSDASVMSQAVDYDDLEASREIVETLYSPLLVVLEMNERNRSRDDWLRFFLVTHRSYVLDGTVRVGVWDSRDDRILHGFNYDRALLRDDRVGVVDVARMSFDFRSENFYWFFENFSGLVEELSSCRYRTVVRYDTRKYNSNWTDMMRDLGRGRMNMALTLVTMSKQRIRDIDFSLPIVVTQAAFYLRTVDNTLIHWSSYFRVFSRPVWLVNVAMTLLVSCLLVITKRRHHRDWHWSDLWSYNFINIVGIYAQQGLAVKPRNPSSRLLYMSVLFLAMNIHMLYSSVLMSFITVPETGLPFSTFAELREDPEYKIIVLNGSRQQAWFHEPDSILNQFVPKLNKTQPGEILDGFLLACNNTVAFYTLNVYYSALNSQIPCSLKPIYLPITEYMSIALTKNDPYREQLDNLIIKLLSNGFLARLRAKFFFSYQDISRVSTTQITANSVLPIITIYIHGLVLSLIILTIEIVLRKKRTVSK